MNILRRRVVADGDRVTDQASAPVVVVQDRSIAGGGALRLLWLSRPEHRNPLDLATIRALRAELAAAVQRHDVRIVAICGRGAAFSAGGDVAGYAEMLNDQPGFTAVVEEFHGLVGDLARAPVPTMALVNGVAVAGGLELLLACDIVLAADTARIGDAHQGIAMIGGGGALASLPGVVGPARAADLVYTGRMLSAEEAHEWGLVSRVVAADRLLEAADEVAAAVAARSPLALRRSKQVLRWVVGTGSGVDAAMALEAQVTINHATTSADAREGVAAFLAKRAPEYRGC